MKKLLKYLLVPVLAGTTTLTVVACGTNETGVPQDVLSSAVGAMRNATFQMEKDLFLSSLPNDKYSKLDSSARDVIYNYYSDLVKPGTTWDKPAVAVALEDKDENIFIRKYGSEVEARITITAHLTFQNKTADKDIVVKINNDATSEQVKIEAIGSTVGFYLDGNPTFNSPTLFKDGLKSDDPFVSKTQIQAPIEDGLFKKSISEDGFPIIEVAGVSLQVILPETSTEIYTLDKIVNADNEKETVRLIQGSLKNLSLKLNYGIDASTIITGKTLTIVQNISDATSQISSLLLQSLQFSQTVLPTAGQTLEDYFDNAGKELKQTIQNKLFTDFISVIYPAAKMTGTVDTWAATQIIFPDGSTPFIQDDENDDWGYFLIRINFKVTIANHDPSKEGDIDVVIDSQAFNVELDITKGTS